MIFVGRDPTQPRTRPVYKRVPFLEASAFFDDASRGRFAFKERNLNFSYLAKIKQVPSCLFDDGLRRDKVF